MQPLKSGQPVTDQWRSVNDVAAQGQFRAYQSDDSRFKLAAGMRSLGLDMSVWLFPFRIYSFPSAWRVAPAPTTDWLKFRIALGYYNNIVPSGCDRTDAAPGASGYVPCGPDSDTIPSESGTDFTGTEYVLASGQGKIYFWIDASTPTAPVIKYGYPGMAVSGNGGDPVTLGWTAFPTPDSQHIPIGWVDTSTDAATYTAHIRQILRSDNPSAGGSPGSVVQLAAIYGLSNADSFTAYLLGISSSSGSLLVNLTGPVTVAKNARQRVSVVSETLDAQGVAYTSYVSDNSRMAAAGSTSEAQVVFPPYVTMAGCGITWASSYTGAAAYSLLISQCVCKVVQMPSPIDTSATPAQYQEIEARVWARKYIQ